MEISIKVQHILEKIAFNLYNHHYWGEGYNFEQKLVDEQRKYFSLVVYGILQAINGTEINPIGKTAVLFAGIYMPRQIRDALLSGNYWPHWANQDFINKINEGTNE